MSGHRPWREIKRSVSEAEAFLASLRRGPVTHQEAIKAYPWSLPRIKRELASQGHILTTCGEAPNTWYELSRDGHDQQSLEGAA